MNKSLLWVISSATPFSEAENQYHSSSRTVVLKLQVLSWSHPTTVHRLAELLLSSGERQHLLCSCSLISTGHLDWNSTKDLLRCDLVIRHCGYVYMYRPVPRSAGGGRLTSSIYAFAYTWHPCTLLSGSRCCTACCTQNLSHACCKNAGKPASSLRFKQEIDTHDICVANITSQKLLPEDKLSALYTSSFGQLCILPTGHFCFPLNVSLAFWCQVVHLSSHLCLLAGAMSGNVGTSNTQASETGPKVREQWHWVQKIFTRLAQIKQPNNASMLHALPLVFHCFFIVSAAKRTARTS